MLRKRVRVLGFIVLFGIQLAATGQVCAQKVRFSTNLGNIDVELLPNAAPVTVANFLGYVDRSNYNQSFIHRSVSNFIFQGGGYRQVGSTTFLIPQQPAIANEFSLSNVRGTISMATLSGNPNSATSQWFFNLANNPSLDTQNGGYTVFGRVADAESLVVMDRIGAVPTYNLGITFPELPLINYPGSGPVDPLTNMVTIFSIQRVDKNASFDFDGDKKADVSVFRQADQNWYVNPSSNTDVFNAAQFGLPTDKLAPADYDGDGKTDYAVWRESDQNFYILNSTNSSVRIENFGLPGDKLTVGDWDGDRKADLATYREGLQSYFYYRGSANNPSGGVTYLPWGTTNDKPVRGDFDGDGKQDLAVYRPANQTWYIQNSSSGFINYRVFGLPTDKLIPADYDGDGRTDVAVFRSSDSTWYILQSLSGQVRYQFFGLPTDTLVPADYDGDAKADIAVYRNGNWYILKSTNGQVHYPVFGQVGDIPVTSSYQQ